MPLHSKKQTEKDDETIILQCPLRLARAETSIPSHSRARVTCSFSTWQVSPARLAAGDVHDQYLLDTCNAATHRILHSTCAHRCSTSIASSCTSATSARCTALTNRLKTRYCSPILLASLNRALHHKQHPAFTRRPSGLDNLLIFTILIRVRVI
jgi:hypothetical protein